MKRDPRDPEQELERAWELLERGEVERARRMGERLLAARPEDPEILLLLGACARDQEQLEEALELFDRAAQADSEWPVPKLWAADLLANELNRIAEARRRLETAVERHPEQADAWYDLGSVCELQEDERRKREAWLEALRLDSGAAEPDDAMSEAEVAAVAEDALQELPEQAHRLLADVPILIADLPAREDVAEGFDPRTLGLFVGIPHPELSSVGGAPALTQILLFRRNLDRIADDEEELREQIRITLLHETGHFFGMDEDDLEAVGLD